MSALPIFAPALQARPPASGTGVAEPAVKPTSAAEIFKEQGAFVLRLLRRLGVPDADLDDVVQDVFVIVHRSLDRYEERSHLRAWLYRIAVREASRHRRGRMPQATVPLEDLATTTSTGPEDHVRQREARADLERLLSVLDEERRTVFVLYEVEELSMEEVVEVVGCPLATGYSRLRSARKLVLAAAKRLEAQRSGTRPMQSAHIATSPSGPLRDDEGGRR
ncbi:MAG: sigma-70 family RNA polymerase sigma factor [Deltaproteobacteria bacterium]|nr:sigma-70 family RNA polymerase sigma factor [Deltaproteobacteria bacterium]